MKASWKYVDHGKISLLIWDAVKFFSSYGAGGRRRGLAEWEHSFPHAMGRQIAA